MNISDIQIKSINRLIAHQIVAKTKNEDAHSINAQNLLELEPDEKNILIERLHTAIYNPKKTFELAFENDGTNSVHSLLHNDYPESDEDFVDFSSDFSERLAESHFRTRIPGGYCLVGEGETKKQQHFFFVIKAELQEVFNIENNELKLIKDVFLSPAKDFYKVGFFVKSGSRFRPFMYDDQFTLQKNDLTVYFYSMFLGLTTDKNDALRSKNFYSETKSYIEQEVDNLQDRIGLLNALRVYFRENTSGTLSLKEFADNHLEGNLKTQYIKRYEKQFPHAFTRQLDLIENKVDLQRVSIPLSYTIKIVGDQISMNNVKIIDGEDLRGTSLVPTVDSGRIEKGIFLLSQSDNNDN